MKTIVTLKSKFQEVGIGEIMAARCEELAEETFTARLEELNRISEERFVQLTGWKKQAEEAIKENKTLFEELGRQKEYLKEAREELEKERNHKAPGFNAISQANKRAEEAEAKAKQFNEEANQKHQELIGAREAQHVAEEQKANAEETNRLAAEVVREHIQRIEELEAKLTKEKQMSAEASGMACKLDDQSLQIERLTRELEGFKGKEKAFVDAENSRAAEAERKAGRWLEECTKANEEANTLKRKVNELTEDNERLGAELGKVTRQDARFKQLGELNTRLEGLNNRQASAIAELKDRLNQKYEEAEKLEAQIKELKAAPAVQVHFGPHPLEVLAENAKLCFEAVRLQELLKTEKKAADALFVQRQEAYKRIEELETLATEITPTLREFLIKELKPVVSLNPLYVESLAQKIAALVVKEKAKAVNSTEANKRIAELASLITDKNKTIEELKADHDLTLQQLSDGMKACINHRAELANAKQVIAENDRSFGQALQHNQAKIAELTDQLEQEIKSADAIAEELGRVGGELGPLREELAAQRSQVTKLVGKLADAEAELFVARTQLTEGITERFQLEEALLTLSKTIGRRK